MSADRQGDAFENLLHEERRFPPSEEFAAQAVAQPSLYDEAREQGTEFWAKQARELLTWDQDFTQTLDWSDAPFAKWFVGGTVNAASPSVSACISAAGSGNAPVA